MHKISWFDPKTVEKKKGDKSCCNFSINDIKMKGFRGCCKSKEQIRYIVIMENIFKDFQVGNRFDLKGSKYSRRRLKGDMRFDDPKRDLTVALKDNDFELHFKSNNFKGPLKEGIRNIHAIL